MKKCINLSILYAFLGLAGGVFYREFTQFNGFTGVTALGKVHTHLLLLGMFMFLIVALFTVHFDLEKQKSFKIFMGAYNAGLILTAIMMVVRGIFQVKGTVLSSAANAMISGFAGIGHLLVGIGLLVLLFLLRKMAMNRD